MAPPKKTHCKRGHPLNETTTRKSKLSSGYVVRKCNLCRSIRDKLRYHAKIKPKRRADAAIKAAMSLPT